jgi:hypothetical protein
MSSKGSRTSIRSAPTDVMDILHTGIPLTININIPAVVPIEYYVFMYFLWRQWT